MTHDSIPEERDQTIAELMTARSPVAAAYWRLSEGFRIVGYSVAFIGPCAVTVFWLFDALKYRFSHEQYSNELKDWYFYVGLAFALMAVGWLAARASARVQASLERHFC